MENTIKLPEKFTERMQKMLGDEYPEFLESYQAPRLRGLRVNTMKIRPEEFEKIAPFPVTPIPWVKNGFFYDNDQYPARHPYYQAGVYYLQEPSAMTPASRLPVEEGDHVLDMCAAPGGKATELAARLNGTGVLVANDASNSRAKALLRNLELFGTSNMLVTNELPDKLSEVFPTYFDKILVDAPCSGEGMFRKAPDVIETWSEERVEFFAKTQRNILENAWAMLRPGGYLMYSTCTFSPDEDEQMMAWFVDKYPDMKIVEMENWEGFAPGRPEWADGNPDLTKTVRIWPHKMPGEGHFLALLRKGGDSLGIAEGNEPDGGEISEDVGTRVDNLALFDAGFGQEEDRKAAKKKKKEKGKKGKGGDRAAAGKGGSGQVSKEQQELFEEVLEGCKDKLAGTLEQRADKAYLTRQLPDGVGKLNFLRNGLYAGEWKKNRFEPSQPLAMALPKGSYPRVFSMKADDERVMKYLRGETILVDSSSEIVQNGWNIVAVDGFYLGWGKASNGQIKNKYLVSWRIN